jgi:hypothetical protein
MRDAAAGIIDYNQLDVILCILSHILNLSIFLLFSTNDPILIKHHKEPDATKYSNILCTKRVTVCKH